MKPNETIALPHHPEAERDIVSILMSLDKEGALLVKAFERIDPEALHSPGLADMARWLINRRSQDLPVDVVSFVTDIQRNAGLAAIFEKCWGEGYVGMIAEIHRASVTSAHFLWKVSQVQDAWHRRQAIAIGVRMQERLINPEESKAETIINEGQEEFSGITTAINDVQSERELALEAVAELEKSMISGGPIGYTTGWSTLDAHMSLTPGTVVTIAAPTSAGKTSFGLQLIDHLCDAAGPCLFLTKEMTKLDLFYKLLTSDIRQNVTKLKAGDTPGIASLKSAAAERSDRNKLHLKGMDVMNIAMIETYIRIYSARGFKAFGIDYLQLTDPTKETAKLDRRAQITDVTRRLKALALSTGAIIIDLCQVARSKRSPLLTDLSESKSIEEDSDQVILIDRALGSKEAKVRIAKDRFGPTSDWETMLFEAESQVFRDLI